MDSSLGGWPERALRGRLGITTLIARKRRAAHSSRIRPANDRETSTNGKTSGNPRDLNGGAHAVQVLGTRKQSARRAGEPTSVKVDLSTAARGETQTGSLHRPPTLSRTAGPSSKIGRALELAAWQDPPKERFPASDSGANRTVIWRGRVSHHRNAASSSTRDEQACQTDTTE
jgi:hypothetical protein